MNEKSIQRLVRKIVDDVYLPSVLYRLQFNKDFTFDAATEYIGYLRELGVDTVYSSPFLKANPGSPHGYDVVDPTALNPEVGSEESFDSFCQIIQETGMGHLIDVVPNHMGIGSENSLWMDVLEYGSNSRYASFFDIDWEPTKRVLRNKILLPILGDQFGKVLENGEIQLFYDAGHFSIKYYENILPVGPDTYAFILEQGIEGLGARLGEAHPEYRRFLSVVTAFRNLPGEDILSDSEISERYREAWTARERLDWSCSRSPAILDHIHSLVKLFNGQMGVPDTFDLMQQLLDRQSYRVASWHVAGEEINYRRFFDINELAAIRMEEPLVFSHCHSLILRFLREGRVNGLRIDHSDGLYDPQGYFQMLQHSYLTQMVEKQLEKEQGPLSKRDHELVRKTLTNMAAFDQLPLYLIIEKILDRKESLPEEWMVHGTVGYDYLNLLNRLYVMRNNEAEFDLIYKNFIKETTDIYDLLHTKKRLFARGHMPGEINVLAQRLSRIIERNRRHRDFTLYNLRVAIREMIVFFPVYRTYIGPDDRDVSERDAKYIHIATEKAKSYNPDMNHQLFDFIRDILLLKFDDMLGPMERDLYQDFILRFQQITSPIMAKGVEDTAFYVGNRFVSLNEVGGDPAHFGCSIAEFHKENADRHKNWPYSMISTSTHDTKRSEDVRQRLNVISEIPDEWRHYLRRFSRICAKFKTVTERGAFPDRNTEYFIYQTLIGVWPDYPIPADYLPVFTERVWIYVLKAIREAKTHTNWLRANEEYENAVEQFVRSLLRRSRNYFLKVFRELESRIASFGKYNTLAAINLRIGSPGVMDNYQGTELWDYSLVDPDNRRPIDFNLRRHLLNRVKDLVGNGATPEAVSSELLSAKRDSRIKIFTLWKGMRFRSAHKELFLKGDYIPLETEGDHSDHLTAFARVLGDSVLIVASGRFFCTLCGGRQLTPVGPAVWGNTRLFLSPELTDKRLKDIYSCSEPVLHAAGDRYFIPVEELFRYYPYAMLSNCPDDQPVEETEEGEEDGDE